MSESLKMFAITQRKHAFSPECIFFSYRLPPTYYSTLKVRIRGRVGLGVGVGHCSGMFVLVGGHWLILHHVRLTVVEVLFSCDFLVPSLNTLRLSAPYSWMILLFLQHYHNACNYLFMVSLMV